MSRHPPRRLLPRGCARAFEPSRLEPQYLTHAYALVLPVLRQRLAPHRAAQPQAAGLGGDACGPRTRALGG